MKKRLGGVEQTTLDACRNPLMLTLPDLRFLVPVVSRVTCDVGREMTVGGGGGGGGGGGDLHKS